MGGGIRLILTSLRCGIIQPIAELKFNAKSIQNTANQKPSTFIFFKSHTDQRDELIVYHSFDNEEGASINEPCYEVEKSAGRLGLKARGFILLDIPILKRFQ